MALVEYKSAVAAPEEDVWAFVSNMDNWAPFMVGYQSHRRISDAESIWSLRGDTGLLSRTVELRVQITEWQEGERVSFSIEGLNEPFNGEGCFSMRTVREEESSDDHPTESSRAPRWHSLMRWLFRRQLRAHAVLRPDAGQTRAAGQTMLTFTLGMTAGGMMGPMLNAVIEPVLLPAAERLAQSIAARIESQGAAGHPGPVPAAGLGSDP